MKMHLLVELDYDENIMHEQDEEGKKWFEEEVLRIGKNFYPHELLLHSNEIGDTVGSIRVLKHCYIA